MEILYCTFFVGFLGVLGQYDCPYKECFCDQTDIYCDSQSLKSIPERNVQTKGFYVTLNLDSNQITTIPAGSLPPNLISLSLQGNPIETIDDTAFDESVNTLQTITFDGAKFTQVPAAVTRLRQLWNLNLYSVNILTWDDNAMKNLCPSLLSFQLVTGGVSSWPNWLKYCSNLTDISITSSGISSIPDDALDLVTNTLVQLQLHNNSLTSVPKAISKMTALNILSLEQNKITDLTWLPQLSNLSYLALTENRISDAGKLSSVLRPYANTLQTFSVYDNFLTSIPDLSFLTKIIELDYMNNHISDPYSGGIPENLTSLQLYKNFLTTVPTVMKTMKLLTELDLSYNRMLSIQGTDIPNRVTGVDLGNNIITELTDTSFPVNSNITYLLMSNNPLSKISLLAFQNLPQLQQLDLTHTKLTRMPLAISLLSKLQYLDVSGNTGLVCTCLEKGLASRISSLPSEAVVGDCGQTSLYVFFTELSHGCPTS
ncbi:unnamed protein product [Candidula unifasciata]|uniref:LRRNT domain-containing protein n=1 Tax=Candidula unifasciata TaxID=100452 RepID=A0A8S3YX02_9EUPU|nr:unnamed protein product [Candidula unifasciata]